MRFFFDINKQKNLWVLHNLPAGTASRAAYFVFYQHFVPTGHLRSLQMSRRDKMLVEKKDTRNVRSVPLGTECEKMIRLFLDNLKVFYVLLCG
jgi:hypothetical protein